MYKYIFLILISISLNAQQIVKKGEKVLFDGMLITRQQYENMIIQLKKLDIYEKELDPNQANQIASLTEIIVVKNQIIEAYQQKYNLAAMRLNILEAENKKLRIKSNILLITNNIGWTITLGYTGGIIAFAIIREF
jgi:hypothetical protein